MFASAVHMIGHGAGILVMAVFWMALIALGVSTAARALSERRDEAAPRRDVGNRSAVEGTLDLAGYDIRPAGARAELRAMRRSTTEPTRAGERTR